MLQLEAKKLYALAASEEFQRIIENDPVLAELSQPEANPGLERALLFDMFGSLSKIGEVNVQPITPTLWAFLWVTENRFVTDRDNISVEDVDQFLFLLTHGIKNLDFDLDQLPANASGCTERLGLDIVEAAAGIISLIHTAFSPLAMIPTGPQPDAECSDPRKIKYGAEWLSGIVSSVSQQTNLTPSEIMFNTPLSTCFSYMIHFLRSKGVENIRERSGAERVIAYNERMDALTKEFLETHPNLGD